MTVVSDDFWLGGGPPPNEPACGFTGSICDYSNYYYIAAAVLVLILLFIGGYFVRRH